MTTFHPRSSLKDVIAQPDARAVVGQIAPEVLVSSLATSGDPFPLATVLGFILEPSDPRVAELWGACGDRGSHPARTGGAGIVPPC